MSVSRRGASRYHVAKDPLAAATEAEPENMGPFGWEQRVSLKRKLKRAAFRLFSLYPPYLGAGISVTEINDDLTSWDVQMKPRPWTRNYLGTHFGGSLYSMCDPFFALILSENLGSEYVVWDKSATIRFKKPGIGVMTATFTIDPLDIDAIAAQADVEHKVEPVFTVQVKNEQGEVVAEVEKTLYVRRTKKPHTV